MKCWVIVPVKRLSDAKSRLASKLPLRRRRKLMCVLLQHTLRALSGVGGVEGVLVVGKDGAVRAIAHGAGAGFIREGNVQGLNGALAQAETEAIRRGAKAVMILPADLPLLSAEDVAWAIKKKGRPPFFLIAPDRSRKGTNLLLMAPPGRVGFFFGRVSFRRHVQAARRAGMKVTVLRRRALAKDLDRPEDLRLLEATDFLWG